MAFCVFSEHASSSPMLHKSRRTTSCTVCNAVILKKNLRRHVTRHHAQHADGLVLPSVLVCKKNGIYMCAKNVLGSHYPTHVQLKTSSSVQTVLCESEDCQHASDIASRSNCASFQCPHICAAVQAETLPAVSTLNTDILDQLVADKVVAQSGVKPTVQLRDSATAVGTPPVACWYPPGSTYAYLSVFTGDVHYYSKLCRVIVRFCTSSGVFDCACCTRRRGCTHKKLALWYIAQNMPDMLREKESPTETNMCDDGSDEQVEDVPCNSDEVAVEPTFSRTHLTEHITRIQRSVKIPANITAMEIPTGIAVIQPRDTTCPSCNKQLQLHKFTSCGKVFDIHTSVTGTISIILFCCRHLTYIICHCTCCDMAIGAG